MPITGQAVALSLTPPPPGGYITAAGCLLTKFFSPVV